MSGQAVISINENQWTVDIAQTSYELTTGLSNVSQLPAGTGMLFILPAKQQVTVDTSKMVFPIDIIFISDNIVIDVASNIQPGYLVTEETPCDSFLEVNAGEADGVEVGDAVSTVTIQQLGMDLSQVISFAIPLVVLGFVCAMVGGMARLMGGSSHSSSPRRLGKPKTEAERSETHERKYGTKELPERGSGHHSEYIIVTDPGRTTFKPGEVISKEAFDRENERARKLGEKEAKGVSSGEHHSPWLTPEQRKLLESKWGGAATRFAEEMVRPGDIEAAKRVAEIMYSKYKGAFRIA